MRYILAAGGLAVMAFALVWLRRVERRDVSAAWQVDHDRRVWQAGVDGVCWQWPVQK